MAEPSEPAQTAVAEPAVEDNSPQASPPSEPTTSEPQQPDEGQPSAPAEPAPAEPVPEPANEAPERQPRPAESRIKGLLQENKDLREQLSTIPAPGQSPQAPKLSDLFQGKEQIMPDELDKAGQEVWQEGAQTARGLNSLEVAQLRQEMVIRDAINETDKTAAQLPSEYEELNPKSSNYNPALDRKIAETYQQRAVRDVNGVKTLDPSVKLADVAKNEVEFYREATESGKAQTSNTLASQADESAITPTSTTPAPDKSFEDMSLKEQEAYLRAKGHDV